MSLVFARALPAGVSGTARPEAVLSLPLSGLPYSVGSKRWSPGTSQKWVVAASFSEKEHLVSRKHLEPLTSVWGLRQGGTSPQDSWPACPLLQPVPLSWHSSLPVRRCLCSGSSRPMH